MGDNGGTPEEMGQTEGQSQELMREGQRLRVLLKLFFCVPFRMEKKKGCFVGFMLFLYVFIFMFQMVKVGLFTAQMYRYGNERADFNNEVQRGHLTLRHLLLENWDASWETVPYPPSRGDYAVYTIDDLESGINFAVSSYYNYERNAIGFYERIGMDNMEATFKYFDVPENGMGNTITISEKNFSTCHGLTNTTTDNEMVYKYSIADELEYMNLSHTLQSMFTFALGFSTYSVRPEETTRHALCLRINGQVIFTDKDSNGKVNVNLQTLTSRIDCATMNVSVKDLRLENMFLPNGTPVRVFCVVSIFLTVYTLAFGVYVWVKTSLCMNENFKQFYGLEDTSNETNLSKCEYLRFLVHMFWDVLFLVSDALTINGTMQILSEKEISEWELLDLDHYTVILGTGCILAWLSVLRYFKVHNKLQLLFKTLYRAIGDVIAYMFCVTVLFVGFWLCGYVVLGPYHVKFRTLHKAWETLFALVNGDEIYATFAMFDEDMTGSPIVLWFARFYIIVYVCTFTIVVINLLIALFLSAYDTMKTEPTDGGISHMERALKAFMPTQNGKKLRDVVHDLLTSSENNIVEETTLINELRRIIKINNSTEKVEILKPRTLKTFIHDEDDEEQKRNEFGLGCLLLPIPDCCCYTC